MNLENGNPFVGLELKPETSSGSRGRLQSGSQTKNINQQLEEALQTDRTDGKYLINRQHDSFLLWFEEAPNQHDNSVGMSDWSVVDETFDNQDYSAIKVSASFGGRTRLKCLLKERPAFSPAKDALKPADWKMNNRFQLTGNYADATLTLFDSPRIIELLLSLDKSITVSLAGQNFLITSSKVDFGIARGNLALRLLELASELTSQLRTVSLPA
ncbi:MAG: hypothetical protein NXI04_21170 [Planctomycetaceae bacterium]|nr:hypothetical protein [Planctomycetaceae bacterium]